MTTKTITTKKPIATDSRNSAPKLSSPRRAPSRRKAMAIYARVSTQEQTKGLFPSCDSQIEELRTFCKSRDWQVVEEIKDEGHRAGTLKRPGLAHLRWMVETEQIEGIVCTWYNRLIGSRDFYILDHEFKSHNVQFVTIHDPADRNTATGRMLESMLVTIKTFENEQVGEKVRTKMRQRAEKGLWNGGYVPFGFICDSQSQIMQPDEKMAQTINQMFQLYVETASDFAVRDWLKAHSIPTPNGKAVWSVSTIHDLLTNRRYIGEIEINKRNKDIEDAPETESYRIVQAPHEPLVSRELFDLAQAVRREKALASPNRRGRPRSFSQNQCNRVFPLQGRMFCGECGHAMTPYYVVHKPGKERKNFSYIYYYICSQQQMKGRASCGHSNRVLAKISEAWIVERIGGLVSSENVIEQAFETASRKCQRDLQPQQDALNATRRALETNQAKIDQLIETMSSGGVAGDLLGMMNEKATELKSERERLRAEQRKLNEQLVPMADYVDALPLQQTLRDFSTLAKAAEPLELQRLMRTMIRRMEWMPDGSHAVEFYQLPTKQKALSNEDKALSVISSQQSDEDWLESNRWFGGPDRTSCEPLVLQICRELTDQIRESSLLFLRNFQQTAY